MKKFFFIICTVFVAAACSKKTVPSKPNYSVNNNSRNDYSNVFADSTNSASANSDSASTATSTNSVMVVTDGYGRLLTSQQNLPQDAGVTYNSLQLSKGFTAQQRANLQARYNGVPPRVLFVPQQYSQSSLKGNYYIYKKKFWYWKKSDGLYYLDQKYYL